VEQKLRVSIRYNGLRYTIEPNDLFEIQFNYVASIISLVAWNKVGHLEKSIHNHHVCILPSLGPKEGHDEIYTYIILRSQRYGKWGV